MKVKEPKTGYTAVFQHGRHKTRYKIDKCLAGVLNEI